MKLPFFAILFILIGASIILKPLLEKKRVDLTKLCLKSADYLRKTVTGMKQKRG